MSTRHKKTVIMVLIVLLPVLISFSSPLQKNTAMAFGLSGSNSTKAAKLTKTQLNTTPLAQQSDLYRAKGFKFLANGGRVSWSPSGNNLITFDRIENDGYYDIYTINADGSNENCLTCSRTELLPLNNGNPCWHPSGDFIVFQSQDPNLRCPFYEQFAAHPGGGINNNLWIVNKEGTKFWQLTHVANRMGILHPKFSNDGTKLLWAERIGTRPFFWGQWAIKLADFSIVNGEPKIGAVTEIKPGDMGLYETHGFSPDDSKITFSAVKRREPASGFDEFIYDLKSGELTNLINTPKEWDEFAQFSPDGKVLIWTSSNEIVEQRNYKGYVKPGKQKMDYWIMNPDGSNKKRLTHFNAPGYTEYKPNGAVAAEYSWNPDGTKIIAKIRALPGKYYQNEMLVLIDLR